MARVVVFAGLPGVGKSSIARELSRRTGLFHLRVDAIEGPFLEKNMPVTSEGYEAMRRVAAENLELGIGSIVDYVNPWPLTRDMFEFDGQTLRVEVVCSDADLHKTRLDSRGVGPMFEDLPEREYQPWLGADIRIDSAQTSVEDAVADILKLL